MVEIDQAPLNEVVERHQPTTAPTISDNWKEFIMGLIVLVVLVLLLLGAFPSWPHSRNWGYGPSGGLGTLLVVVVILYLLGYIPR
jgi:VIT1/CCC1 family predicted Fe2+/Mn2+ transporter